MQKTLLLPGWMRTLKLYKHSDSLAIHIGNLDTQSALADYVIGLSLGALVVLREIERIRGKVILINPPLPKRNLLIWLSRWIKYFISEGLFLERQKFIKNPLRFALEIMRCIKLLRTNFEKALDAVPKDRLIIIRGKTDKFFCDDTAANFIRSKGIRLFEVAG